MRMWITCAVAAGAIMWGDVMAISTLVELPRDVWITLHLRGGQSVSGRLVDSDQRRVILDGERRHHVLAEAIDAVTTEKP